MNFLMIKKMRGGFPLKFGTSQKISWQSNAIDRFYQISSCKTPTLKTNYTAETPTKYERYRAFNAFHNGV